MKQFLMVCTAIIVIVTGVLAQEQKPARDQEWLKQLVGEWDATFKTYMQPDQPPIDGTGTDIVRALGENWVIAETDFTMMGTSFSGVLSVGYDQQQEQFHGTWIDSVGSYLWVYNGALNETGDTLTLESKGPSMQNVDEMVRYKDVMTIKDKDHRTFTSSMETEDGEWVTILEAEYHRKK